MLEEKLSEAIDALLVKHVKARNLAKTLRMDEDLPIDIRKEGLHDMRKERDFIFDLRELWISLPMPCDLKNKSQFISRRIDELLGELKAIIMESNNGDSEDIHYTIRCIQGFLDFLKKRNGA